MLKQSLNLIFIFLYFLDCQTRPSTSKRIYQPGKNQKRQITQDTEEIPGQEFQDYEASESDTNTAYENEGKLLILGPRNALKNTQLCK